MSNKTIRSAEGNGHSRRTKAIGLLSGGLDSRLAVKLLVDQDIEVEALSYLTLFCTCTSKNSCRLEAKKAADDLRVPIKVVSTTAEFLEIIANPKHGYGKNMNPCIDCRLLMFRKAGDYMRETGASFVFTGEVVGERPMSQRLDAMRLIERESGLAGYILRPLSAKLLPLTIPEQEGLVDREKLLDIRGRSRKPQMALAEELGMQDYPCPAGGCLLTDADFSARLRDLLKHDGRLTVPQVKLLKRGRHFRLSPAAKAVVGRNQADNGKLELLARSGDWLMRAVECEGPVTVVRGEPTDDDLELAGHLTARYSQGRDRDTVTIEAHRYQPSADSTTAGPAERRLKVAPRIEEDELARLRI